MKGDFSRWEQIHSNINAVLHQQGRVLLDRDWNDQARITNRWQDQAAHDIIGSRVLAIPAATPQALQVLAASVLGSDGPITLKIHPGSGWADGIAVDLPGSSVVLREATYLGPPIHAGDISPQDIQAGIRDAVVLEAWREELNAFQYTPEIDSQLLEPALGGVDTTERVHTAMRFRLLRLEEGDTCRNIYPKLQDDESKLGTLRVTLKPHMISGGECPVATGGGFLGFEHSLYRFEIADVDDGSIQRFKWAPFNGGLVGRGEYDVIDKEFIITANHQAITTSDRDEFYLEVVDYDPDEGFWRVIYGAEVTLDGNDLKEDNILFQLAGYPVPTDRPVFFRLWHGIEKISKFKTSADPAQLENGLFLEFGGTGEYRPGDFWSFDVRVDHENEEVLVDQEPPHGIEYVRVPVAILRWDKPAGQGAYITYDDQEIFDCRDIFRPLIDQTACCSFVVGDGVNSFGDFNSIEEAFYHLPCSGGELCLLPGVHRTNLVIEGRQNIKIKGCDLKTLVLPREDTFDKSVFQVIDSHHISFEHMTVVSVDGGVFLLSGEEFDDLYDIQICHNRILSYKCAAKVWQGKKVKICHNQIRMIDKDQGEVAIKILAEDSLIERNDIAVIPPEATEPPEDAPEGEPPEDDCVEPGEVIANLPFLVWFIDTVWSIIPLDIVPKDPYKTLSGIQIANGAKQIVILENKITGGAGNGISLGSYPEASPKEKIRDSWKVEGIGVDIRQKGVLDGQVLMRGEKSKPLSDMEIRLVGENGDYETRTDPNGNYRFDIDKEGKYKLSSGSPKYRVDWVEETRKKDNLNLAVGERDIKENEEDIAPHPKAFIDEVLIDKNIIAKMQRSGVGLVPVPQESEINFVEDLSAEEKRKLSANQKRVLGNGFAVGLTVNLKNLEIYRNHIFDCVSIQSIKSIEQGTKYVRGEGGISLGICEDLTIRENKIENIPFCGIFVLLGMVVDISQNKILNPEWQKENPLGIGNQTNTDLLKGLTKFYDALPTGIPFGGIYLKYVVPNSFQSKPQTQADGADPTALLLANVGKNANFSARIEGNTVHQPVGQALHMNVLGSVSIQNNFFHSELTTLDPSGLLAGVVWVWNLGGSQVEGYFGEMTRETGVRARAMADNS